MNKLRIILIFLVLGWGAKNTVAQYPHILVNDGDKQVVLDKIKQQPWAKSIFDHMQAGVTPYVEKHKSDPKWILSRYQMNRVPGKRYTTVYSDQSGSNLIRWSGDAPVPTVKVNTYLRSPITEKGTSYRKPTIEELIPNDTSMVMNLFNPETGLKELIEPQAYTTEINGDINNLALDAAILYWLNGEEKYAKFAASSQFSGIYALRGRGRGTGTFLMIRRRIGGWSAAGAAVLGIAAIIAAATVTSRRIDTSIPGARAGPGPRLGPAEESSGCYSSCRHVLGGWL